MHIIRTLTVFAVVISFFVGNVQAQLDEQVPYQGDTLLTNPNQYRVTSEGDVLMDCDWPAMMTMVRDLEERIAGEAGTDTTYGVYVSGEINGSAVNMWYDCVVLRDSILALQVAYDEVLSPRVTTSAPSILSDTSAALSATFTGSGVTAVGFNWGTDENLAGATNAPVAGTASPFSDTLSSLLPGTAYYVSAYVTIGSETVNGDTLAFLTKPAVVSDSTSAVSYTTARIHGTLTADSITSQGFKWGTLADLSDAVDSTGTLNVADSSFHADLTGLSEGDTLYFLAYATNASGTTYGDTLSFSTLVSNKILSTSVVGVTDTTVIISSSFEGSTVTTMGYKFADNDWGSPTTVNAPDLTTPRTDTIPNDQFAVTFQSAQTYYFHAFVTDGSETESGDTLSFTTLAQVQTSSATAGYSILDLAGSVTGESIQSSGFYWSYAADLSNPTDVPVSPVTGAMSHRLTGLSQADTIYYSAYASNDEGVFSYGDTLKIGLESCVAPTMEGYTYAVTVIFEECWFTENLRTRTYADGSVIPNLTDGAAWGADSDGAQVIYDNDSTTFYADYGRLYNWFAVNNAKGLCPTGWSVASEDAYSALIDSVGGASVAGGFLKASPQDSVPWNGTNDYGFTMVDGGGRLSDGSFILQPDNGFLWTSTEHPTSLTDAYSINFLLSGGDALSIQDPDKNTGASVRCLKVTAAASVPPQSLATITTSAAGSVSETGSTLNATYNDNGSAITANGFIYGTDASLASPSTVAGSALTSPFSAALSGLTGSTTYYFAGFATNAAGTAYGDTLNFTTSAPCPSTTPGCPGYVDPCVANPMGPGCPGAMDPCIANPMGPGCPGFMDPCLFCEPACPLWPDCN